MSKKVQTIKPESITSTLQFSQPSILVRVRENIERQLFAIAKEHADISSQDIDRSNVEKTRKEMKHSIIAIVMCYTALEALSNDLYKRLTDKDFDSDDYKSKFKDSKPTSRWKYLTRLAYQQKHRTNKIRSLPSDITKDLDDLTELRHQIIHYKPKSESPERLKKFADNSPVNPELELFTSDKATEAIQTMRTLLDSFEKVTGMEIPKLD